MGQPRASRALLSHTISFAFAGNDLRDRVMTRTSPASVLERRQWRSDRKISDRNSTCGPAARQPIVFVGRVGIRVASLSPRPVSARLRHRLDDDAAVVDRERVGAAHVHIIAIDHRPRRSAALRLGKLQDQDRCHGAVVAQGRRRPADGDAHSLHLRGAAQLVAKESLRLSGFGCRPAITVMLEPTRQLEGGAAAGERRQLAVGSPHSHQVGAAPDQHVGTMPGGRQH